jgi:hypothetical protein
MMIKVESMEQVDTRIDANTTQTLSSLTAGLKDIATRETNTHNEFLKILAALSKEGPRVERAQKILESLYFQPLEERRARIRGRHAKTFSWVFEEAETGFPEWLSSENGIFWISGKAGSGKSTLMKYLDPRQNIHQKKEQQNKTEQLLRQWAGSNQLLVASHYFWSSGTTVQKSLEGLQQHLLYQILCKATDMIPMVCPNRWSSNIDNDSDSWDLEELRDCFKRLSEIAATGVKFCLFIDGLDEYDGTEADRGKFVDELQGLAISSNLKICVSSRPWTVFERSLGSGPHQLSVHKLTRDDIKGYVHAELSQDQRFIKQLAQDPQADQLVKDIVKRADGVFLWVELVVKQLLKGLSEEDDIEDLQRRLNNLPDSLEEYFKEMIKRIDKVWQNETAQVLRLAVQAIRPQPILVFSCLRKERSDSNYALSATIEPLSDDQVKEEELKTRERLNKLVLDFLEVEKEEDVVNEGFPRNKVEFLHRTVKDFLTTKDMSDYLKQNSPPGFNPETSLCKALLWVIKKMPIRKESDFTNYLTSIVGTVDEVLFYINYIEQTTNKTERLLLDELDRVNGIHASHSSTQLGHWTNAREPRSTSLDDLGAQTFEASTIQAGLCVYVAEILSENPNLLKSKQGRPLLDYALRPAIATPIDLPLLNDPISIKMVRILLNCGADPNQLVRILDDTVWGLFLKDRCLSKAREQFKSNASLCAVIEELIHHHADSDIVFKIPLPSQDTDVPSNTFTTARSERKVLRTTAQEEQISLTTLDAVRAIVSPSRAPRFEILLERERKRRGSWYGLGKFLWY